MCEALWLPASLTSPLLLLVGGHPGTLVREVAIVAPSTHIMMWVVAASLAPDLCAHRGWGLIRGTRAGAGLLDRAQTPLSHAVWGGVTPGPLGHIIFLQHLFLPQRRGEPTTLSSRREYLWPPGELRIHWGGPAVGMPWMLLPVKRIRPGAARIRPLPSNEARGVHAGRVVVHWWRTALHHAGVHVGHYHPAGVKVHRQRWRSTHVAGLVQWPSLLWSWSRLGGGAWGGTLWSLWLGGQLALGRLAVLLLVLPLLLLL